MIDKNELKGLFKELDKKFNDKDVKSFNEYSESIDIVDVENCPRWR